jgi:hypothetical protein
LKNNSEWAEEISLGKSSIVLWKEKGWLNGMNILVVGDMRMRTMHLLYRFPLQINEASLSSKINERLQI